MNVAGSTVGVWRLRSEKRCAAPNLTCRLSSVPEPIDGGPDSGQYLDATTWDSADARWSIGTQDADALYERSIADDRLPAEWAKTFRRFVEPTSPAKAEYPVTYLRGGLQIRLPDLPAHTTVEVHQAAAWRETLSPDDVSTWWAVDLGPGRLQIEDL